LKAWITLRTCGSSVRTSRAISGADMPVADANGIIARWRLAWYLALLEIDPQPVALLRRQLAHEHLRRTHRHLQRRGHASPFAADGALPVKRFRTAH
jgi:hypothetical protein